MAKVWKAVLIIALILLALGVLLVGAGLLTGASVERAWTGLALEQRFGDALDTLRRLPFWPGW